MLFTILLSSALAAPPGWNIVPFGVGVYLHHRPVRGAVYSLTQAGGIAAATAGSLLAADASEAGDDAALGQWSAVTSVGVAVAAGSYVVSLFDAGRLHDLEDDDAKKKASSVRAWDAAVVAAREEP